MTETHTTRRILFFFYGHGRVCLFSVVKKIKIFGLFFLIFPIFFPDGYGRVVNLCRTAKRSPDDYTNAFQYGKKFFYFNFFNFFNFF